jgi:hypothetical protein
MRTRTALLAVVGFLGLLSGAPAQTPSPAASGTAFDGTYRFVSSAKVNQTYTTRNGRMGFCPDRRPGPLHIANDRARYTNATGYRLTGMVGPQGELALRVIAPPNSGNAGSRFIDMTANGAIDASGTVRARQIGGSCSYDFIWQK